MYSPDVIHALRNLPAVCTLTHLPHPPAAPCQLTLAPINVAATA